jgi:tight adherence protein C
MLRNLIPAGLSIDDVAVAAAGILAAVAVLITWYGLIERNPLRNRLKSLEARRRDLNEEALGRSQQGHAYRAHGITAMRRVVERLNLLRSRQADKIAERLAQAGFRSRDSMIAYLFFKVISPLAFGAAAIVIFFALNVGGFPPTVKIFAALLLVLLGAYAPDMVIRNAASKRRAKIRMGLPDGLDLLVICAEAGLSLDAALVRVAREMREASPELADEFGLTAIELGFLPDRRMALENLNNRTQLPAIRAVVNTLLQTERYGTPLSKALRVLGAEFRTDRLMRAEEKAARLPALLTVPMIVFILPTLFIVLIGPGILQAIDGLSQL